VNVLGLDLSITATGVCWPDGTTDTIKGDSDDGDRRLVAIVDRLYRAHLGFQFDLAVLEDMAPIRANSIGVVGMVHGAVRLALLRLGIPYVLLPPASLKAYATGSGTADKHAMRMAAFKRAGLEFKDDNQCDAWWARHAGLDWYGHPEIKMPEAQRARLDKAKWPAMAGKATS
jgi:Holliday junction resolvasome RuvABC endonuclease subunit